MIKSPSAYNQSCLKVSNNTSLIRLLPVKSRFKAERVVYLAKYLLVDTLVGNIIHINVFYKYLYKMRI